MKKSILSIFVATSILVTSSIADVQSITATPIIGVSNSKTLTGLRLAADIGNDWSYETTAIVKQNDNSNQAPKGDYQFSLIAKKENVLKVEDFNLFIGAGIGEVFDSVGATATVGAIHTLKNNDSVRVDISTQGYDAGKFNTYLSVGYSFALWK